MKKLLLPILVCLLASAVCQEQPTAKQCRADRAVWGSLTGEDMDKLSYKELQRRETELDLCRFRHAAQFHTSLRGLPTPKLFTIDHSGGGR
jgi:hypothetical protein